MFLSGKAIWEQDFSKLPPGPWGLPVIGTVRTSVLFTRTVQVQIIFYLFIEKTVTAQSIIGRLIADTK